MIFDAFPYQFLHAVEKLGQQPGIHLPHYLKELVRAGEISQYQKLEEFLQNEVQQASLQDQATAEYFFFISRQSLDYFFHTRNREIFQHVGDLIRHRIGALRQAGVAEFPFQAWESYLDLYAVAFQRVIRHVSIETFEQHINNLDWEVFGPTFIPAVSRLIGMTYTREESAEQGSKSRLWLQKAMMEDQQSDSLFDQLALASFYLSNPSADHIAQIQTLIQKIQGQASTVSGGIQNLAILELDALKQLHDEKHFDDAMTKLEHAQIQLRQLESSIQDLGEISAQARAALSSIVARLYANLYEMTEDDLEKASFTKHALQQIDQSISLAQEIEHAHLAMEYRMIRSDIAIQTKVSLTEKEMKEIAQFFKKRQDYPSYSRANWQFLQLLELNQVPHKGYDVILDGFKYANKRLEQGGVYLQTRFLQFATSLFGHAAEQPGVSWMVELLDGFFDRVQFAIDKLAEHRATTGKTQVYDFINTYDGFEPVSHFNVKVYYRYQWYQIKALKIGSLLSGDETSTRIADRLLGSLEDENNPLSFMSADWDDFKKVPNSVRNKTLNKCINISKGDLPLAAEHLDFSYRNLRSYITFKEVNRLGFFLDMQETSNRQLEQGIRYMFYDLYKRGTIFEVVFDMPKFLVEFAKSGFYSQDLEEQLNIKGTTAKKYIKIMMEIGLIRQDKTTGRKHFYRLVRENIMNRLGKDQTTLIQ
ncbi:helix-turn-helix domain-containing protein [Pontibacter sp. G13]|uniref:helix-turn-helix domain-containing protein n=1 Tax=Pontibacter sp. G13 TaxID=3074898 RepID=UPI00288AFBB5|nr:helix-turn-helix domain-containing protein [Pontibacter sp. G13]WNJ20412.1 helix-turn-helix domain-containing protein [Pontibacter sp. G13]